MQVWVVIGLAFVVAAAGISPVRAEDANEFWPEVQLHYWFDDHRSRAIAMTSVSRNRDSDTSFQAGQGLTFEHRFADYFAGRLGYRHGAATDGGSFTENRALAEQIFRLDLALKVIAEYRAREEFRWLNSGFSVRLRERLKVRRDFTVGDYVFSPYASAEVFFDTRYGTFNRYRLTLGVSLPTTRQLGIEPYLVRQNDWVPTGVLINALGFKVIAQF